MSCPHPRPIAPRVLRSACGERVLVADCPDCGERDVVLDLPSLAELRDLAGRLAAGSVVRGRTTVVPTELYREAVRTLAGVEG